MQNEPFLWAGRGLAVLKSNFNSFFSLKLHYSYSAVNHEAENQPHNIFQLKRFYTLTLLTIRVPQIA